MGWVNVILTIVEVGYLKNVQCHSLLFGTNPWYINKERPLSSFHKVYIRSFLVLFSLPIYAGTNRLNLQTYKLICHSCSESYRKTVT